jgi:Glutamine amidotransferase domain
MCGLVGAAGAMTQKAETAFKQLLILDSLRGVHSTGCAAIGKCSTMEVKLAKAVGNPFELLDSRSFEEVMKRVNKVLMGHNRFATQGKVNRANAHPFEFDDIVGAHNGTLINKHNLLHSAMFDVDSENLYHHMNEKGLKSLLEVIEGAWALTWYNKTDDTLNFLRNKERPLWMTVSKEGTLFWASEYWMLEAALSRNDIEYGEIYSLPVDTHLMFEFDDKGNILKPHSTPAAAVKKAYVYQGGWVNKQSNSANLTVVKPPEKSQETFPPGTQETKSSDTSTQKTVGVIDSKKLGVTPKTVKTVEVPSSEAYSPSQEVSLTVGLEQSDAHGNFFYNCHDLKNPNRKIRLYKKKSDRYDLTGKVIEATMHQYCYSDRIGIYWKVSHASVKLAEVEKEEKMYQDHKGKLIPEDKWNEKYGACSWCSGWVNPELSFKFSHEGDAVCHVCADDKEVHQYVNLK